MEDFKGLFAGAAVFCLGVGIPIYHETGSLFGAVFLPPFIAVIVFGILGMATLGDK